MSRYERSIVVVALSLMVSGASAHGWVTKPVSKNHMEHRHWVQGMPQTSFRWEPQSSANGNLAGSMSAAPEASCGAQSAVYTKGLGTWRKWYESAKVPIPTLVPGGDIELEAKLTADHGGQAWLMVACGDHIGEDVAWTYLERAAGDRGHHFMASKPGIYAWRVGEFAGGKLRARYTVPSTFSCPGGHAVGRWLWKTGNSCIDSNNVGRSTESFSRSEYDSTVGKRASSTCTGPPEIFISCIDFEVFGEGEGPAPTASPSPTPTPEPEPTLAPTPTPSPLEPEPEPEPTPAPTPAPSPPPSGPCAKEWQKCGGDGKPEMTCCEDGLICTGTEWWKSCKRASSSQIEESNSQHKVVHGHFLK